MANMEDLIGQSPVKMLSLGYPGTGKTGALAALANMGLKLRIIDINGNPAPLFNYVRPEFRKNVDIVTLTEKLRMGSVKIVPDGQPKVFGNIMRLIDEWKYIRETTGEEVNLGKPNEWGLDTVLVLDTLTHAGKASLRRQIVMNAKQNLAHVPKRLWQPAQGDQEALVEILVSRAIACNVVVNCHLKMIGPKEVESDDDDVTKEVKKKQVETLPFRLFPSALGRALPPEIGTYFPIICLFETKGQGKSSGKRIIRTAPRADLDIKVPIPGVSGELPLESGLATIFRAMGVRGTETIEKEDEE